jgi:hypothetical protein
MGSAGWLAWREGWRDQWVSRLDCEPVCLGCGKRWALSNGDLHHRSYQRLGAERFIDVIPLCRRCHDRLHAIYDNDPAWRRLGRARATDLIVARLHNETSHRPKENHT